MEDEGKDEEEMWRMRGRMRRRVEEGEYVEIPVN